MALTIGTQLGSHEIIALLGKGGMGEVYRARDLKLKREVAIKILPDELARDADRLARFQREAEVLASLNHPRIAAIHDLQQVNGSSFLILELVEGETLAEHIARGLLPVEEALRIARQIAEALEAAHAKGIIHRDLKPENVKIKPDGDVKVLDFGLARVFEPDAPPVNSSQSPTLLSGTMGGVILGTAAYMSPEQARGQAVTDQSDIWSFGVVLYEMLAGKQAFTGDTITDVLAGIVKLDPDWTALPETTPPVVRLLLRHCLQKNRSKRLHHIADARIEIDAAEVQYTPKAQTAAKRSLLPWAAAAVCALVALGLAGVYFRETTPPERTLRYTISAPENSILQSFAISPDGRFLAMAALVNGKRQLWLRPLDALQAQPMPGTDDATYPFWSPDSRYIAFFSQERLKKVAVSGGPSQSLCDAPAARGGSWGNENVIVFSPFIATGGAIEWVPASGGVPVEVFTKLGSSASPVFLPDGRHFLYRKAGTSTEDNGVYWSSLDGSGNRRVLPDVSTVWFSPSAPRNRTGHVLFIRENTLMALPFDAGSAQALGDAFPVAQSVFFSNYGFAPVTGSENGLLVVLTGGATTGSSQLAWFDRAGKLLDLIGAPGQINEAAISPDEKTIAFRRGRRLSGDLWLRNLSRGTDQRFTSAAGVSGGPFWSPGGDRIVFNSNRSGGYQLYQKAANGSGQDDLLFPDTNNDFPTQWSRDGHFIVYTHIDAKTLRDIWIFPVGDSGRAPTPDRKATPFLHSGFNEQDGQLSPDSKWMAFSSDASGQYEIYVRPFPSGGGERRISTAGGNQPRWRGDGKELFFVAANGKMTSVAVTGMSASKSNFEFRDPVELFDAHPADHNFLFGYDVTADGKRFLVDTNPAASSVQQLTVVVNWQAGLKK